MICTLVAARKDFFNSFGSAEGHSFADGEHLVCPYAHRTVTVHLFARECILIYGVYMYWVCLLSRIGCIATVNDSSCVAPCINHD